MNYEELKNEFIKFKKEELYYIDNVSKISNNKILSEFKKLEIHRTLNNYRVKLDELLKKLRIEVAKNDELYHRNPYDVIIGFDIDENYFSYIAEDYKEKVLNMMGINEKNLKFELSIHDVLWAEYWGINCNLILVNQKLISNPIYILCGYHDYADDVIGLISSEYPKGYIYGVYKDMRNKKEKEIPKEEMDVFEKNNNKNIIYSKKYVSSYEAELIFEEELLNDKNNSLNDCILTTKKRIEELNFVRSPEYKEKVLLDKINELYQKVNGEFIKKEVLYNGDFLKILKETYTLPNGKTIEKEKVIKNGGKNSVIVIAITQEKEYIITFQNRIKDEKIAEFPSGYIENEEEILEAAKRELQEETGYTSDDLFVVDEAFTSPGIDNSTTYIVLANNCIKTDKIKTDGTELVNYGLFLEEELKYLIRENIMNGAMNKLAYYNLINNVDDCNIINTNNNKKIYKKQRKKTKSTI